MRATRLAPLALVLLASSVCAQAHWTLLYPAQSPSWRQNFRMAYDGVRGESVLFGGSYPNYFGDTWTFDGSTWTQRATTGPSPRHRHAMVFDEARGTVVLFGGSASGVERNDTWEWNGTQWSQRQPTQQPASRDAHGMAYDRERQITVMFGGVNGQTYGDTWEWDGQDWQQVAVATSPAPRFGPAMAFDPSLGGVLLFGGKAGNLPSFHDTWRWNGTLWQLLTPPMVPPAISYATMDADLDRRRVVLLSAASPYAWEWDGTTWAMQAIASPTTGARHALVYDRARRQVVLFKADNQPVGTWIYATDDPATFEIIGAGCIGTTGTPELHPGPYSLPWIGDTFDIRCLLVPFQTPVIFATGYEAPSATALDLFGMPGCALHVTVLETQFRLSDPTGTAHWSLQIPNSTSLAGVELAQQALVLDPPVNAAGAVVSTAAKFTIGIR